MWYNILEVVKFLERRKTVMKLLAMQVIKTRTSGFLTPCYLHWGVIGGFCSIESIEYMSIPDFCEI